MSESPESNPVLAREFPGASREDWLRRVESVLKGQPFTRLVGKTPDGIEIQPLYERRQARPIAGTTAAARWRACQRIDLPKPGDAARQAMEDLEGGADGLILSFKGSAAARGFGLDIADAATLDGALDGVMPELIGIRIETAPFDGRRIAGLIDEVVARRGLEPASLVVDFGLDPVGDLARTGALPAGWPVIAGNFADEVKRLRGRGYRGRPVRVDGRPWHEAGGSEAQELAGMLATGVAYLRALEASGMELSQARGCLDFTLTLDADQFLSIAKLRALRLLWARVEEACGLGPEPVAIHAETAWRMLTRRDPWVNLLRSTVAGFAAAVGGADSVCVLPFTAAIGLPDAFARRLGRNTQALLLEESNLWRVADPASGAGGSEALTDALCGAAWALFQGLERAGGIVEALQAGTWQETLRATRETMLRDVATKRRPLTGTSEFPLLGEAPVTVLAPAPSAAPASAGALPAIRLGAAYEALRDAAEAAGQPPRAFLATLGSVAAFTARATYAKNFLEAGGIAGPIGDPYADLPALLAAFKASGATLACLCGTDDAYAESGEAAIRALSEAGAVVVLAGRPGEAEARLRAAGLTEAIFVGCDALAVLSRLHVALGIAPVPA